MGIKRHLKSLKRKPVLDYQHLITLHYITHTKQLLSFNFLNHVLQSESPAIHHPQEQLPMLIVPPRWHVSFRYPILPIHLLTSY